MSELSDGVEGFENSGSREPVEKWSYWCDNCGYGVAKSFFNPFESCNFCGGKIGRAHV